MLNRSLAAVSAVTLLLLTACAVAGTEFRPGVAAQVGEVSVTNDQVDELAANFCLAVEDQIKAQNQQVPVGAFTTGIASQLIAVSAATQLGNAYGVEAGDTYRAAVTQARAQTAGMSEAARDAFIEVQSAPDYIADILLRVGAVEMAKQGRVDATDEERLAAGQAALGSWSEREGVTIDPRYGLTMVDGMTQPGDTDVSYAFGDLAKAGNNSVEAPAPDYLSALPAAAICG